MKQKSLRSLHKMMAARAGITTSSPFEAHAEQRLERRGIASRAQPAIVSRLIAGGRRVHAFIRAAAHRDRNGIEETGKEPADMRLPCNRLLDPSHADRATMAAARGARARDRAGTAFTVAGRGG